MDAEYLAALTFLSWLPEEPIASFRRGYDPTIDVVDPHITLFFPVPTSEMDRGAFREHVKTVVSRTPAFDIRLNALEKAWDHWLFLVVTEGRDQVIELHDELYTGLLRSFLWTEQPFVPHVGLGLFVETGDDQDLHEARPRALDSARFERGLREAQALDLDFAGPFESLHIVELDEDLTYVTRLEEVRLQTR
jgi:2'-5' RNA ligase